jgi:hypothetical protein
VAVVVDLVVVAAAEGDAVLDGCWSVVSGPVQAVVAVAPGGGNVAAIADAVSVVAGVDGAALGGGEAAGGASGVEDLSGGAGDDPGDLRVAGDPAGCFP